MGETGPDTKIVSWTAAGLVVCSVSAAILIGNIGFQGDDWWQFAWPYWNSFPYSIWEYIKESRRPVEGLYTVLAFETFGLNRIWYNLSALLLSMGSCLLMGACLKKAFPGRDSLVVLSALFAFVLTPLSNLLYMFHTDNSRLSVLLFWVSVWAFQRWAQVSPSWHGLILPVLLYYLAAFTYENTTFLIFSVPLFVWPIHTRNQNGLSYRSFLLRVGTGITAAFTVFVLVRFAVFSGGAVGHSSLIPPWSLAWTYITNLALYCLIPFRDLSGDKLAWTWGCLVALIASGLLYRAASGDSSSREKPASWERSWLYVAVLGLAVLVLGMLPYLMAGYDSSMGFTSQSRIYSAGSYGVAILLGLSVTAPRSQGMRSVMKVAAVVVIALMAVFFMDLRNKWLEAAEKRDQICANLVEQVPDVAPGTTFLFLDLQWYLPDHGAQSAVVFQGVDGLGQFVRMLYDKQDLHAYFLYPKDQVKGDKEGRSATASQAGLVARGSAIRPPIPLDSLLIFMRQGSKLVLLDTISERDSLAAIHWNGVTAIHSNKNLIMPPREPNRPRKTPCPSTPAGRYASIKGRTTH
ncbi:MAG: hypothetical protein HY913_23115 [Desulfomonile tiedjei]|nr:hypothetical protein [Desulfomonile tiedjei]